MIQVRFWCSTQTMQNHSNTPAGPIYLHAATNLCPPQKRLPPELQKENTPTFNFLNTNKCNQSKKECTDKGLVTFITPNMLFYLADLTDIELHLLQEQIYCHTANCTTGITLPAVLNRLDEDNNKIKYSFVCHGYCSSWITEMVLCHHLSHAVITNC